MTNPTTQESRLTDEEFSLLKVIADIRFAIGDNGRAMLGELADVVRERMAERDKALQMLDEVRHLLTNQLDLDPADLTVLQLAAAALIHIRCLQNATQSETKAMTGKDHPFFGGYYAGHDTYYLGADDRVRIVKQMTDPAKLRAVLQVEGLQKTVQRAALARLKKLEKQAP